MLNKLRHILNDDNLTDNLTDKLIQLSQLTSIIEIIPI